jgi:hypothetical protein
MDRALSLGLGAWRHDQRSAGVIFPTCEAQLQEYARGVDDLRHRDIGVASKQRHGRRRSEGRGGVSRVMRHMEAVLC